jgi:Protein of unknown function (DUF2630)
MDERDILSRIHEYVNEEHKLRDRLQRGDLTQAEERQRLQELEVALDQCWDLLRQRRAKSEFGEDPESAKARPEGEVEGYLQ